MAGTIILLAAILTAIGVIYTIGKDFFPDILDFIRNKNHSEEHEKSAYKQVTRHVNNNYINESGLKDLWEKEGYKLYWSSPKNVPSYELKGYEIMYGIDDQKRERFSLEVLRYDGSVDLVLMGKKENKESS